MKPAIFLAISSFALCTASGQTPAPDAEKSSEAAQLEALEKKIDQQNAKIDALSQEILNLEQQLSVARGETLTSIAKLYKVTVDDLQNANHIEDGRKLQAGQTIIIPTPPPAGSSSSSPN